MKMNKIKEKGFFFLLAGVLSGFLMPYVLGAFYPKFNPFRSVISLLGDVGSPVQQAFLVWSVVTGIFYLFSLPAVYQEICKTSVKLARIVASLIAAYALGEEIFSGIFSLDIQQPTWNFSSWMHNIGSAIGFSGFMVLPYFIYRYYEKKEDKKWACRYFWLMLINFLVIGFYFVSRMITMFQFAPFHADGFFQRLSYFFNYLPVGIFALNHLKNQKQDDFMLK